MSPSMWTEEDPDVAVVLLVGAVGPEGMPHAEPFLSVLGFRGTDLGHGDRPYSATSLSSRP